MLRSRTEWNVKLQASWFVEAACHLLVEEKLIE